MRFQYSKKAIEDSIDKGYLEDSLKRRAWTLYTLNNDDEKIAKKIGVPKELVTNWRRSIGLPEKVKLKSDPENKLRRKNEVVVFKMTPEELAEYKKHYCSKPVGRSYCCGKHFEV